MSSSYILSSHVLEYLSQNSFLMVINHLRCFITHVDFWKSLCLSSSCCMYFFFCLSVWTVASLRVPADWMKNIVLSRDMLLVWRRRPATPLWDSIHNHTQITPHYFTMERKRSLLMKFSEDIFLLCGIYWKSTACLVIFICVHLAFMLHN